jgi:hypothetical protein
MSIIGSNILAGASGQAGGGGAYEIERSVRFNAPDSSFLSRTPGSAGNRKTWTWAGWVKKSLLADQKLFGGGTSIGATTFLQIFFDSTGTLRVSSGTADWVETAQVFRDFSGWYHFVVALDTTQATGSNRLKLYVNGFEIITFSADNRAANISQNTDYGVNINATHHIGSYQGSAGFFSGLLADIHFIDSQALTPSAFGEFDTNGVWQPIEYTGTYGTNGFHLPFSDNSTAAALGTDTSSNGNTWTVNNLAVTGLATSTTGNISLGSTARNFYFKGLVGHQIGCSSGNHVWDSSDGASWTYRGLGSTPVTLTSTYLLLSGNTNVSFTNTNSDLVTYWDLGLSVGVPNGVGTTYTWNVNAFGAENIDSLVDSPTNYGTDTGAGGEVRGNYATFNPIEKAAVSGAATLANGNLDIQGGATEQFRAATIPVSSGKWYFEIVQSAGSDFNPGVWSYPLSSPSSQFYQNTNYRYNSSGGVYTAAGLLISYSSFTTGDIIGTALDLDNGKVYFSKNGVFQNSSNPVNGTNPVATGLTGTWVFGASTNPGGTTLSANFGQRQWAYAAPAGFKALCTTNLAEPTIADGSTAMDVKLYTGNGSTQTISGLNFSPDLVWIKARSSAFGHGLFDIVRGTGLRLSSDGTGSEQSESGVSAFNSDGFSVGSATFGNNSSTTMVAWTWDAGSSTVTNTQGSITSQVRANASAGFSVVTYTGNGTDGATVGHGLGVTPGMVIVKRRDVAQNWVVAHSGITLSTQSLALNLTTNATSFGDGWIDAWSSTTFTTNQGASSIVNVNANTGTYVAYCWSPVAGYSAFGSYTGNGSADGPFVYTGFRSRWVMIKRYDGAGNWVLIDTARSSYNTTTQQLFPNSSDAEYSNSGEALDILSNGFKPRSGTSGHHNFSGYQYLYIAFAESPFQYARAR